MFLNHFKLIDRPFCETPPPDRLPADDRFGQALARLEFFRRQSEFALVVGQTGAGKTSLLGLFRESMPKNRYRPVYPHLNGMTPTAFPQLIVARQGEPPRMGKDRLFLQIIDRIESSEAKTVPIFEEAHLISPQSPTDPRLLACSSATGSGALKILSSGQESLLETLKRSAPADLNNRISIRCRLRPLSKPRTSAYIDHRLRMAGGNEKIFASEAKEIVHDYSGGVPRQIDNIATACLIGGAAMEVNRIGADLVNETMSDFGPT